MSSMETIVSVQEGELSPDVEILKLLDELVDQPVATSKPLIQKVPSTLRRYEDIREYFKPRVISIGPIHHRDPALQGGHRLKLKLAAHFVRTHDVEKKTLYRNIRTEIAALKKSYDPTELEPYCDEELAWMFFLDGSAILQAIYLRYASDDDMHVDTVHTVPINDGSLIIKNDFLTFVYLDLFLLENQLPFRVLELLTGQTRRGRMFMDAIEDFIDENAITPAEMKEQQQQQQQQQRRQEEAPRVHLLDLLRKKLIFTKEKYRSNVGRGFVRFFRFMNERKSRAHYQPHTFRNVKELKSAGIRLKLSKTSCLKDVSFNRVCCQGQLWLPPITVDNSTGTKFMNLIAYEMCPDFENDFTVTSYICFLNSLIAGAEDVKELRDAMILYNGLGNDEEVAKLFNKMNTDLVPSEKIYSYVKWQIQNHCQMRWIPFVYGAFYSFYESSRTRLFYAYTSSYCSSDLLRHASSKTKLTKQVRKL